MTHETFKYLIIIYIFHKRLIKRILLERSGYRKIIPFGLLPKHFSESYFS